MHSTLKTLAVMAALLFSMNIAVAADTHPVISIQPDAEKVSNADIDNTDISYTCDELSIRVEWRAMGVWGKVMVIAGFEGNISSQAWSYL